jgi:hypothetical protein
MCFTAIIKSTKLMGIYMYKNSKWATEIIKYQDNEGKWGYFHTLFKDSQSPYTTEKALKRLEILGYTIKDDCINKAVSYMSDCLSGVKNIPDKEEKLADWNLFTQLILATWIRRFTKDNSTANNIAKNWASIITTAFEDGDYNHKKYLNAYINVWGKKPKGGRLVDFAQFYIVSIVNGYLNKETEMRFLKYIINKPDGIYYSYENSINVLPNDFTSKKASMYLGCIELIAEFDTAKHQLQFVVDWLQKNKNENEKWDMGKNAKDGLYYPLSDDWRKKEKREFDCTYRISNLLQKLNS